MADPIRVLHVDDEPGFADTAAAFLERENDRFEVETATSADAGLDRLGDVAFDCVISDYDMPGRNGIEFLRAVRESRPDLPFVLYTGKGSEAVASEAISAGVTDYLRKESGTDQYAVLANRIENAVTADRAERQRQRQLEATEAAREGISILDEDGHYVYVNEAFADLHGYEPDELIGEHWEMVHREEDVPEVREEILPAVERAGYWHGTTTSLRADGTTVVVDHTLATTERGELVCTVRNLSERRTRERELETERTFVEQALDIIDDVFYVVGTDGELRRWNDRFAAVTGYTDDELAGMHATAFFPESERSTVADAIETTLATGGTVVEADLLTADGGRTRYEFTGDRLTDPDGEVIGLIGTGRDVSERRAREERLRRTTARLEALFEESPDMINVHDMDGNVIDPNPRLCEETGYDTAEFADMSVWDLDRRIDPESARELWRGMDVGDRRRLEGTYRRRDGSTLPVEVHIRRLRLSGADRFLAIARDITERKAREEELRRERALIEQALDTIDDLFYLYAPDGALRRWNDRLVEVTGYSEDALPGMHATEFFPEEERETVAATLGDIRETGSSVVEADLLTADGDRIPYEFTGRTLTGPEGGVIGLVGTGRDVSERRAREEQLRQERDRLDEFTRVVSHDLRNPLNIAQARLDMARQDCDSDHLEEVDDAHDRMAGLIEGLLGMARDGEALGETAPVDLGRVADACWHGVATRDATLRIDVDRTVRADESRLRQLLENLYRNAVEHGDGAMTVTVGELEDGFYVEDDGPGIPESQRHELFQAGYSTTEEGTGSGLAIVQQVADAHGWDVRVTGDADGARFEFTGVERVE